MVGAIGKNVIGVCLTTVASLMRFEEKLICLTADQWERGTFELLFGLKPGSIGFN